MELRKCFFFVIMAGVFLIFCWGQEKKEFRIIQEKGTRIAENPGYPIPASDSPNDIVFTEGLKLGATKGEPHYIFSELISFTVDDKKNIYVLDRREKTVRKFNPIGEYLESFGREGQGPGEFIDPETIQYLPGEYLMIFEGESQKYSSFTTKGELVKTQRFRKLMFSPYLGFTNGNYLATHVDRSSDKDVFITGVFNENAELILPLNRLERDPDPPWPAQNDRTSRARRIGEAFSRAVFRHGPVVALSDSGFIYFGFSEKYEIKIFKPGGQLYKIIRAQLPFLPVDKQDEKNFLENHIPRDLSTWNRMDESFKKEIIDMIRFPDKKPAFISFIPMRDDFLIVLRQGEYGRNALIDIFDPSGRFIIEKQLDFPIIDGLCRGDCFYTKCEDELGNQFIKCYKFKLIRR